MRAIVIRLPGGPEVLELAEVPRPEPGKGEVRVRVAASGVNRADLIQRRGHYPAPPGWPADIPGLEFSGTIDALGEGAEGKVGQRVIGIVGGGGYAEAVVLHGRDVVPVPEGMSLVDAGAVPEVFMTAFDALFLQMELALGETLLVHAVGSGVGTAALQLARAAGARVIGTSRTAAKLERARELGLEHGVLAGDVYWTERVLELTAGRGADVILDLVGGPYLAGNQKVIASRGRMIVVGATGGSKAEIDLRALMAKRASITATVLRARPLEEKIAVARAFTSRVVPALAAGTLRPIVDGIYPPEQAGDAHRRLEASDTFGKLLIRWE
ncbi:MAG: NAD(P)H-quinone oxidoreductase [Gemmatimonadetes bacterium]|nr:NAD(P)H-quinone oxidoreductase [Gemmatimonadota bacterium]